MGDMRKFVEFISEPDDLLSLVMLNGKINGRSLDGRQSGFIRIVSDFTRTPRV